MERRFWYGLGILAVLLGLGLWTGLGMENRQKPVTDALEQAAQAALAGDMTQGAVLVYKARSRWETTKLLTAMVADHGPMEEIESLFAQVQIYAQAGETEDFAAYCTRLVRLVAAIGEAHRINWQNLL